MIEIAPKGMFSGSYTFRTPGMEFVEIVSSSWRERAEFELQGQHYQLARERAMSGKFLLKRNDAIIASAAKPSIWRDRFTLDIDGQLYMLRQRSIWRRAFIVERDDQEIGCVTPAGAFSRRVLVDLPAEWPLPIQVFVFWLALIMWRRERQAAASAS